MALRPGHENHFGLSAAAFLHSDMNFLRSLPWSFLASASFEHCSEAAVRGASAFFSAAAFGAGAVFATGAAGVVVCANAELASNKDAIAVAAAREENVIMTVPRVEDEHTVAA
jgi:predicted naringenin-chalcone synthase